MFRRFYCRGTAPIGVSTMVIIFVLLISSTESRSIDAENLTIDRSEVPARYVFEIDEVQDELSAEIEKSKDPNEAGYSNSDLTFHMPIALAVFCGVILLVCCFCCLRCAVTYDGIKRRGITYGRSEKSGVPVVDAMRRFKSNDEPIKK